MRTSWRRACPYQISAFYTHSNLRPLDHSLDVIISTLLDFWALATNQRLASIPCSISPFQLAAEEAERMRRQHEEVVNSQPQDTQVADEHGVELGEAKLSLPAELQKLPSDDVVGGTP